MKELIQILWIPFLFVLISCTSKEDQTQDIEAFITKYDNEDFSKFRNVGITRRGWEEGNNVYMVSDRNKSPYVVSFNNSRNAVTKINRKLLLKSKTKDYFTDEKIKYLMTEFANYNVESLSCDDEINIYISLYSDTEMPFLLRLSKESDQRKIKKGYVYKHYKGRWYS